MTNRKAPTYTCGFCGMLFQRAGSRRAKYCGYDCAYAAVRRQPKVCIVCGAVFTPKRPAAKFCSRPCAHVGHRTQKPPCRQCGQPVASRQFIFCSQLCATLHQAATGRTVNGRAPAPVGAVFQKPHGYVYEKAPDGRWYQQHRLVMSRQLGRSLLPHENVHHLDGDRANNHPDNLELWGVPHPPGVRLDLATGLLPFQHD